MSPAPWRQRHTPPVPVIAHCAGCLRDIYRGRPIFRASGKPYCSADCLVKGPHHVDPSLCGGCHGAHRLGVRP